MTTASIRTHLLLLVLAISVPLMAALGFGIYTDFQQTISHSKNSLRTLASTMISNTGGRIDSARQMLERLALRPLVQQVDAHQCDPLLKDLHTLDPTYANTVYTNLDGLAICSADQRPDGKPVNATPMHWYQEFRKTDQFSVGQPHYGPISKKWVSVLSAPIRNERQEMVGAVHLSLDLKNYDPHIPDQFLPEGSRYGFFSADGVLIWRNLDPEGVIGTRPNAEAARRIVELRDGEFESLSVDGVTRFFSVLPMPDTGWVAFVGVPVDSVFAAARQRAISAALMALVAIGALLLLATAIARRISRPIVALERSAHAVHGGEWGVRAELTGPREVVAVAQELNAMLDTQQRSEAQLRAFLENSAVIAWLKDEDGRHVFASDNFLKRFSLSRDAVIGKTDAELWPGAVADVLRRNDLALLANGQGIEVVEAATNPDGSTSWWLSSKFVFQEAGSKRLIGGLAVDISERRRVEDELRKLAQAVEQSPVGLVITNLAAEIEYVNEAFIQTTGRSREELIGRNQRILQSGRTPRATYQALWKALSSGHPWQGELINRHKDGHEYFIFANITPLRQPDGRITHYVGAAQDITEKKRLGRELDQHRHHLEEQVSQRTRELQIAKAQAEAANQSKSIFLANMSHELRTPLNAILGFAQLMGHDAELGPSNRQRMETINRAGQHLLALINDVLEIARIESGRVTVQTSACHLAESLATVEELIRSRAVAKGLLFHVERRGELADYVLGDCHRIKQVLINLLGNAVKFTDQGSVLLRLTGEAGTIRFEVIDTGPGLSADEQAQLFQAFYQTSVGIATGEGTGLGLTISREFVRLMGGDLRVDSAPGQGCVFSFSLALPSCPAPQAVANPGRVIGLQGGTEPPRILVVEDNADSRALILQMLEPIGFAVRCAENGQLAVDSIAAWQPHFIWMDMRMPQMDGYEATRQIRALPGGQAVKIVALTASAFEEDRQAILSAGCNDMLRKPVTQERLFAVLGDQLALSYRYAATQDEPSTTATLDDLDLSLLPLPLREQLKAAAERLDLELARELVETIRTTQPHLADNLERQLGEYRFDRILASLV